MCVNLSIPDEIHTTTKLSLRVSSIQNPAYRFRQKYIISCMARKRQTYSPGRLACRLTNWPVAQCGTKRSCTEPCNLAYVGQWAGRIANRSIFVGVGASV